MNEGRYMCGCGRIVAADDPTMSIDLGGRIVAGHAECVTLLASELLA